MRKLMPGESFRMVRGRRLMWWQCAECGDDLGPAAAQLRMANNFPYPIAMNGRGGRVICGECWAKERGITPIVSVYTKESEHVETPDL